MLYVNFWITKKWQKVVLHCNTVNFVDTEFSDINEDILFPENSIT